MEVFISWTRADEDVKNVLAKKLQDAGISCWDSDEQCTSNFAEECIAAVKKCSVFIAIVSDASMEEGYVQNEITTARNLEKEGKLNILVYKITDSPYTDKFEFLLNHISFVTGNIVNRVSSVSGVSSIDTIVHRTQELLKKRKEGKPEKPFDVNMPEIDGLKLTKPGYFVDGSRDDTLQAIEEGLSHSNVLILAEFFGFGKKSAIRKFVEQSQSRYHTAVMAHNDCQSLREFFTAGLNFLNVHENVFSGLQADGLLRAKLKFLEKLDAQTLLVIPDVQLSSQADTELCEMLSALKCHIILLTQDSADSYADWFPVVQVGRMQDQHLYQLFFHHYARAFEEEKEALEQPLSQFFANIGGHTKTVELTAATLNRDLRVQPEDVPKYLSMQGGEGMALKDRILQQIEKLFDAEQLEAESLVALLVAAYIAVPHISEKDYRSVLRTCGVDDWKVVTELDQLRWLDVDIHNRTVSMEPVVAQVLFSKLPDTYPVMLVCLEFLMERYRKAASFSFIEEASLNIFAKLEYFLRVTDFPECAAIVGQLHRHKIEGDDYDTQKMIDAIAAFEQKYPLPEAESIFVSEDAEEADDTEEATEEVAPDIWSRETVEEMMLQHIRGTIPFAKLVTKNTDRLLFDASSEGSRLLRSEAFSTDIDIAKIVGISKEELAQLLEYCRAEMQDTDNADEDSVSFNISVECIGAIDALYKRDFLSLQLGVYNILTLLSSLPPELLDTSSIDLIIIVFQTICKIYAVSGSYAPIIHLCERMLQFPVPDRNRLTILHTYVISLRKLAQHTDTLYQSYEEMLKLYDKTAQEVLELRADIIREKKEILLMYATDLARGENVDKALLHFVAAQRLEVPSLMDSEAACAYVIVEILVKTGDFQRALAFIRQYFTPSLLEILSAQGNAETQKIIEDIVIYKSATETTKSEFSEDSDPRKHKSYYQSFSRKNNGLLEQKYYNIADDALDYDFSDLTLEEITEHSKTLRKRARKEKMLNLAPEAFALASEAGFRVLGYRHHMVQYMGAAAMAEGKISEILNGEGKTYTILLTAFLHSLYGKRVYVIDRSPYLTARNYQWMHGVYALLGITCAHVTNRCDLPNMTQNVIYTDLHTLLFGFLEYEMNLQVHRASLPLDTVIIDEADTTLVDEASQIFRLYRVETDSGRLLLAKKTWLFVEQLSEDESLYKLHKGHVLLQPESYPRIEAYFGVSYATIGEMARIREIESYISNAIWCHVYAEKDQDYFIKNDIPMMEDRRSGTLQRFPQLTEYFLCCENELDTRKIESQLCNKMTSINCTALRDFFNRFQCVCGTTATAVSFREEFRQIYGLEYFCVPPHRPVLREDMVSPLYTTIRYKEQALMELVEEKFSKKQPLLIVTQSTGESERYAKLLKRRNIPYKLLNAKNADACADMMAWAGVSGSVLVTNALAGRGADIKLGGNPELRTRQELVEMGEDISCLDSFVYALPTPVQKESALYKKYHSILERNKAICSADRQTVLDAGGLCVIGTGFFPEPRTEQQTRGRCGRQGDVGESWTFRSMEDEVLREMLTGPMLTWMQETLFADVEIKEYDTPILRKSIQSAQKRLHHKRFAEIRNTNDKGKHIHASREDFIGKRFALTDGKITVSAVIESWCKDKVILQQLQRLQKGEPCTEPVLRMLYEAYPELQNIKGFDAGSRLFSTLNKALCKRLNSENYNDSKSLIHYVSTQYLQAWEEYIQLVIETVDRVETTEQSLTQYLRSEKERLLRNAAGRLLMTCCNPPRRSIVKVKQD